MSTPTKCCGWAWHITEEKRKFQASVVVKASFVGAAYITDIPTRVKGVKGVEARPCASVLAQPLNA